MNVFYNLQGIGDTLILKIKEVELNRRDYEKKGDVVRIFDRETKETIGYNFFQISSYGQVQGQGAIELNEEMKTLIENVLSQNGMKQQVELEQRPLFVVGFVEQKEKHPNADKLNICSVDIGDQTLQIVCGAPNVDVGQRVVVALEGAVMPSGLTIKKAALRGVESNGMICSAKELALPDAPQEKGILVLDDSYQIGAAFK